VLRLISGSLRRDTVLFRKPADVVIVTAVIHHFTSTPAYQQYRTRDVLNRTTRNEVVRRGSGRDDGGLASQVVRCAVENSAEHVPSIECVLWPVVGPGREPICC
jgi:hypothetical protein